MGLLALAGVASAASKSLSSSIGSGGASSSRSIGTSYSSYGQKSSAQPIKVVAELKLRGPDLVAVLRGDTYRTKLVG